MKSTVNNKTLNAQLELNRMNEEIKKIGETKITLKKDIASKKVSIEEVKVSLSLKKLEAEKQIYNGPSAGEYKNDTARKKAVEDILESDPEVKELNRKKAFYESEIETKEWLLATERVNYTFITNKLQIAILPYFQQ